MYSLSDCTVLPGQVVDHKLPYVSGISFIIVRFFFFLSFFYFQV